LIRVLVVDDHEIMRRGLSLVFELEDGFDLVGEAYDGEDAVEKVRETRPDVVLMDIRMPRKNGIQASKEIKRHWPETKIMVLSAVDEEDEIIAAIQGGIDGYMLKNTSSDELTEAVRVVAGGQLYLHPTVARKAMGKLGQGEHPSAPVGALLTARESRVLYLMAKGQRNKEIAATLYLSEETVKSHVSHILTKLEQADRMGAVLYGLRHKLIYLDDNGTV